MKSNDKNMARRGTIDPKYARQTHDWFASVMQPYKHGIFKTADIIQKTMARYPNANKSRLQPSDHSDHNKDKKNPEAWCSICASSGKYLFKQRGRGKYEVL